MKCTLDKGAIGQHCGEAGDLEPDTCSAGMSIAAVHFFRSGINGSANGTRVLGTALRSPNEFNQKF